MTKEELVELYNKYLQGNLSNEEGDLWEGIYDFSSSFLCYIKGNDETKQDCLEDLIYNLMTMSDYFRPVNTFNQLVSVFVGKLKKYAQHYYKWENKEQGNYGEDKGKE